MARGIAPQADDTSLSTDLRIAAGRLFDSYACEVLSYHLIIACPKSGLIQSVEARKGIDDFTDLDFSSPHDIDLRHLTVLPGFVDVHVHCEYCLYSRTSYVD